MIYLNQNTPVNRVLDRDSGRYLYQISLGNVIFNDTIFNYENVSIPIFEETIFIIPSESGKFAAINVYLNPITGEIVYDKVATFDKVQDSVNADCLFNVIPLAQFIVKQVGDSFEVIYVNEYSRMGTFSITTSGATGYQGTTGVQGGTGVSGYPGVRGIQGVTGIRGILGIGGLTGQSIQGPVGPRGDMGELV